MKVIDHLIGLAALAALLICLLLPWKEMSYGAKAICGILFAFAMYISIMYIVDLAKKKSS